MISGPNFQFGLVEEDQANNTLILRNLTVLETIHIPQGNLSSADTALHNRYLQAQSVLTLSESALSRSRLIIFKCPPLPACLRLQAGIKLFERTFSSGLICCMKAVLGLV